MALFRGTKAPVHGCLSRLHTIATPPSAGPYVHAVRPRRPASGPPSRQWAPLAYERVILIESAADFAGTSDPRKSKLRLLFSIPAAPSLARRVGEEAAKESTPESSRAEVISGHYSLATRHSHIPSCACIGHQARAPRAPLNEDERVKAHIDQRIRRRSPGARSEICSSSVVLGRPWSTLF
jgi:hypothetical protein